MYATNRMISYANCGTTSRLKRNVYTSLAFLPLAKVIAENKSKKCREFLRAARGSNEVDQDFSWYRWQRSLLPSPITTSETTSVQRSYSAPQPSLRTGFSCSLSDPVAMINSVCRAREKSRGRSGSTALGTLQEQVLCRLRYRIREPVIRI